MTHTHAGLQNQITRFSVSRFWLGAYLEPTWSYLERFRGLGAERSSAAEPQRHGVPVLGWGPLYCGVGGYARLTRWLAGLWAPSSSGLVDVLVGAEG